MQDPELASVKLEEVSLLCQQLEEKTQMKSLLSIYIRHYQIGQIFSTTQDFQLALKMSLDVIKDTVAYFEGNEINEALVDPLIIVCNIKLQAGQPKEAMDYLIKAETVVQSLMGEISDKMIEILNTRIQILSQFQKYEMILPAIQERNKLALSLYGIESEQYCELLEEEALFAYQIGRVDIAIPCF